MDHQELARAADAALVCRSPHRRGVADGERAAQLARAAAEGRDRNAAIGHARDEARDVTLVRHLVGIQDTGRAEVDHIGHLRVGHAWAPGATSGSAILRALLRYVACGWRRNLWSRRHRGLT